MKQLSVSKILVVSRFLAFGACSQASVSTCVDPGVTNGGPILLGTIADVHLRPRDQASATLTVDSYLRNAGLTEQSQTVKVDWIPAAKAETLHCHLIAAVNRCATQNPHGRGWIGRIG